MTFYRHKIIGLALLLLGAMPPVWAQAMPAQTPASFDEVWARAERQNADIEAQIYAEQLLSGQTWRDGPVLRGTAPPHDKAIRECITAMLPTPSPVRMVFSVDASGKVTQAWTDQEGYVAECMPRKTLGMPMPRPPADGFLLCHTFEKSGDSRQAITGCGPRAIAASCEQQGTTTRCRYERRP